MARRKDQDARRAQLAEATERAVLARGLEGLRLRDIAEEADLTPAAVLYYGGLDRLVVETFQQAMERFCGEREAAAERAPDARERMRACIEAGVATGPGDRLPRLLFEFWPRSLRDPAVAAMDSTLFERQVSIYYGALLLGREQGLFTLREPARTIAACLVAMEDGFQTEILAGRRTRTEVIAALHSYVHAMTGCDLGAA
ncbi:TetR/AcrR family transcriptional regulator [Nocardiopsis composta]|uniref:AcrR family transcriptional regulator n=1 Tax=Nocardiopsis composta TaxID=157465 RepID=A0A7W8QKD4_9ACTN|nr:TetR family transcriptional regulator C-terminal domain-containing protein [Nocardiopsis composta]MBB5431855.1 AcrR family transcriptional regulator [Nocardiopsis composta]